MFRHLLLLLLVSVAMNEAACPSGYTLIGSKCYGAFAQSTDYGFTAAETTCTNDNGIMFFAKTEIDYSSIISSSVFTDAVASTVDVWYGMYMTTMDNVTSFEDGSTIASGDYVPWAAGQPNTNIEQAAYYDYSYGTDPSMPSEPPPQICVVIRYDSANTYKYSLVLVDCMASATVLCMTNTTANSTPGTGGSSGSSGSDPLGGIIILPLPLKNGAAWKSPSLAVVSPLALATLFFAARQHQ